MAVPQPRESNSFTVAQDDRARNLDIDSDASEPASPDSAKPKSSVSLMELINIASPAPNPYMSTRTRLRTASANSMTFVEPCPITLVDHTVNPSDLSAGIFARKVTVNDYTIVSGNMKVGAYVVWNFTLETLEGNKITLRKRYSEFDRLREKLAQAFPRSAAALPPLPRKSVVSKFRPAFLEQRRQGLNYFLSCVLMNPEFCASPLVKQFLFERD